MRIGHGYDVHRLVEDRDLILGGVQIPHEKGLLGHSDADVLIHAICDALLGAANMRDIGYHFPDTGVEYENIDSKILLRKTVVLLKEKGYKLYLTTNPIFPSIATQKRMKWAGLNRDDFEIVTTYEDFYHTKPNTAYYQEVIDRCGLDTHECMMVGNDVKEDGAIQQLGVDLYLVDDFLLNKYNLEINCKYRSNSQQFLAFVKQLPEVK